MVSSYSSFSAQSANPFIIPIASHFLSFGILAKISTNSFASSFFCFGNPPFPFWTNFGQILIFHPSHAILTPVTKPLKTRSYKGFADSRRKVIYLQYMPSAAFVRCPCKHGCQTHCCAKMNRVFVTFHS